MAEETSLWAAPFPSTEVSWTIAFITPCFLTAEAVCQAASSPGCHGFPAVTDCAPSKCEPKQTLPTFRSLCHSRERSNEYNSKTGEAWDPEGAFDGVNPGLPPPSFLSHGKISASIWLTLLSWSLSHSDEHSLSAYGFSDMNTKILETRFKKCHCL